MEYTIKEYATKNNVKPTASTYPKLAAIARKINNQLGGTVLEPPEKSKKAKKYEERVLVAVFNNWQKEPAEKHVKITRPIVPIKSKPLKQKKAKTTTKKESSILQEIREKLDIIIGLLDQGNYSTVEEFIKKNNILKNNETGRRYMRAAMEISERDDIPVRKLVEGRKRRIAFHIDVLNEVYDNEILSST